MCLTEEKLPVRQLLPSRRSRRKKHRRVSGPSLFIRCKFFFLELIFVRRPVVRPTSFLVLIDSGNRYHAPHAPATSSFPWAQSAVSAPHHGHQFHELARGVTSLADMALSGQLANVLSWIIPGITIGEPSLTARQQLAKPSIVCQCGLCLASSCL